MAPERFGGGRYDFVSDVWSIGIMTLEALTGKHPYKDLSFIAQSMAVCQRPSPLPPEGTPEEIAEFIRLCLIKENTGPEGRPGIRSLVNGAWMKGASRGDAQAETASYLQQQKGG